MNDLEFKRRQVVDYYEKHASVSYHTVARKFGVSKSFVHKWVAVKRTGGRVEKGKRKDGKAALRAVMIARAVTIAEKEEYISAAGIASKLKSQFRQAVSASTVRRWLRQQDMQYAPPKFKITLTAVQREKRVAFGRRYRRLNWNKVLVTDSKVFYCFPPRKGHLLRRWTKKGRRHVVYTVKHSQDLHVYLGVSSRGVTKLHFCSGSTGHTSKYTNKRTNKPHSGVCAQEYQEDVLPKLAAEAQQLFNGSPYRNSWVYQQDGAPIHTTNESVATIRRLVPGGLLEGWPPNSPDISWIENIWAWMEKELRCRPICKTAPQLKVALTQIWEDLRTNHKHMLKKLSDSMSRRLEKVLELNGAHIGY